MAKSTRPVKIIQVTNTLRVGGAENCIRLLITHTDPKKFSQQVVCTQAGGPFEEALIQKGIAVTVLHRPRRSIILFPLFLWDVLVSLYDLYGFLKKERPDILQTHLPASAYFGVMAGRMAGIPHIIYTFHSSNLLPPRKGFSLRNFLRRQLTRILCRRVEVIVAVSQAIRKKLLAVIPDLSSAIRIIPNGIEVQTYGDAASRGMLKKSLGMSDRDPLITTVGSLSPVKNQAMLLKALSRLMKVHPEVRAVLVGQGPLKTQLMNLSQELGLTPYVHFLGLRQDVPEILAETDIFVSTSLWEGLPLAILEAMAAGKPIVATGVPGVLEVLDQGSGILIESDNSGKLEEALHHLIEEPGLRADLSKRAKQRVVACYSLEKSVQCWEKLYDELMGQDR